MYDIFSFIWVSFPLLLIFFFFPHCFILWDELTVLYEELVSHGFSMFLSVHLVPPTDFRLPRFVFYHPLKYLILFIRKEKNYAAFLLFTVPLRPANCAYETVKYCSATQRIQTQPCIASKHLMWKTKMWFILEYTLIFESELKSGVECNVWINFFIWCWTLTFADTL